MKYPKRIKKIYKQIVDLEIQGATNVAIQTFQGILASLDDKRIDDDSFLDRITQTGNYLAFARPNEPLAQNGVVYLRHFFLQNEGNSLSIGDKKNLIEDLCNEFLDKISSAKHDIETLNGDKLKYIDHILTHCHSTSAIKLIEGIAEGDNDFTAVCTETRPRQQGRITAKELLEAGISTTYIADSAAESFVIGRGSKPVSAVFIGCDVITMRGHCINKVGSWGIAMSAHQSSKPLYVVTPLLKIDHDTASHEIKIEIREDREIWENAPEELEIYNPAFEIVDAGLITGYITEYGIIKPNQIASVVKEKYPWLFIK